MADEVPSPLRKKRVQYAQLDINQRLDYACECMGISKQAAGSELSIDFCLDEIGKIDWVCHFPMLKELTIVNNSVTDTEGIDKCRFLEKIWLNQNLITQMSGFQSLGSLRHLYLGNNKIQHIKGLETCHSLTKLWLDSNEIQSIKGLSGLKSLEDLNLACNLISTIGTGLDSLAYLKELNLSANRIGSFKEVLNLSRLPKLESVSFSDANYGENPICLLCNYSTYVLFHLPTLSKLDTKYVTDDERQHSESTFMKKRMYYNMRIKLIQKNTNNVIQVLKVCRAIRHTKIAMRIDKLQRKLQEIVREQQEREEVREGEFKPMCTYGPDKKPTNPLDLMDQSQLKIDLEHKRVLVASLIHSKQQDAMQLETWFDQLKKYIYGLGEQNTARLITELDTGGNIRFEEGKASDKWYQSCVDLAKSRFNLDTSYASGASLQVIRVTRIHNKFLRTRFEEKLDAQADMTDPQNKKYLEYLFTSTNPKHPKELLEVMEAGFGLNEPVPMFNSVAAAEASRLLQYSKSKAKQQQVPIPAGQMLVSKVFLQKYIQDSKTPFFQNQQSAAENMRQAPLDPTHFQGIQSVFRVKEQDPKQRMWVVMDPELILPEFLIDFTYGPTDSDQCNTLLQAVGQAQTVLETQRRLAPISCADLERADMACLKGPLHQFMSLCHIKELAENNFEFTEEASLESSSPPEIPMRSQFNLLTEFLVVNVCRTHNLSQITTLNLFNNCIKKIQSLEVLSNLQWLNLSYNQIDQISGLTGNTQLKTLDLSHNFIKVIEGLESQKVLAVLDLEHNWISEVTQVAQLTVMCPALEQVGLKANPIATQKMYRQAVCLALTSIKLLDGSQVKESDRVMPAPDDMASLVENKPLTLESLNLGHRKIETIAGLAQFKSLRKLVLRDNKICAISGLDGLYCIEELNLEKNKIANIDGLQDLKSLKKLDLGSNQIKRIKNLQHLNSLAQLSLENNQISRLDGLEELSGLMELYIDGNLIPETQEILKLKDLPRLVILDSTGNPMNSKNYRIFCIFTLRKLRVLDGISIDPQEHLEAKDTFSGRLTSEAMELRLQGKKPDQLRELDLSNCKLRDFEDTFDQYQMPSLRELNLNHNMMQTLKAIGYMPQLKILRLRNNRLETLFVKPMSEEKNQRRGLFGVLGIEFLDVQGNNLQFLYGLQTQVLKDLKVLLCGDNSIAKIEHLDKLRSLREFDISKNKVRTLEPRLFYAPSQLSVLRMDENPLKQLTHIETLDQLRVLSMSATRVAEFAELERIADLTHLSDLSLANTPLSRKPQYRTAIIKRIPQVNILDGKEIPNDEKRRILESLGVANPIQSSQPGIHFAPIATQQIVMQPKPQPVIKFANINFDPPTPVEKQRPQSKQPTELQRKLDKPPEPLYQPSQLMQQRATRVSSQSNGSQLQSQSPMLQLQNQQIQRPPLNAKRTFN